MWRPCAPVCGPASTRCTSGRSALIRRPSSTPTASSPLTDALCLGAGLPGRLATSSAASRRPPRATISPESDWPEPIRRSSSHTAGGGRPKANLSVAVLFPLGRTPAFREARGRPRPSSACGPGCDRVQWFLACPVANSSCAACTGRHQGRRHLGAAGRAAGVRGGRTGRRDRPELLKFSGPGEPGSCARPPTTSALTSSRRETERDAERAAIAHALIPELGAVPELPARLHAAVVATAPRRAPVPAVPGVTVGGGTCPRPTRTRPRGWFRPPAWPTSSGPPGHAARAGHRRRAPGGSPRGTRAPRGTGRPAAAGRSGCA